MVRNYIFFSFLYISLFMMVPWFPYAQEKQNSHISEQNSGGDLTLNQAFSLALKHHPELKPYAAQIRAHDGLIEQAGLSPNPELEMEAENILGSGEFQGVDSMETTMLFSQLFETADKRNKRKHTAELDQILVRQNFNIAQLDVLFETNAAFIELLTAQKKSELYEEFQAISERIYETIKIGVEAGRDSPMEETRARVMASSTQIAQERAQREREKAKYALAKQWGSDALTYSKAVGTLELPVEIPKPDRWIDQLDENPRVALANAEVERKEAGLDLEQAKAVPDFKIGTGVRYMSDVDDGSFVFGFSIPLPFVDRNQGAIRAAKEFVQQAEAELEAQRIELKTSLQPIYQELLQAFEEAKRLETEILPSAQEAFEAAQEGYRQGKFPYIDVLDAQRSLFEFNIQHVEAKGRFHQALNRLNHLSANYEISNN